MPAYRSGRPRRGTARAFASAFDSGAPEDWPPLPPPEPNPRLRRQIARGLPSSTDDIVPLMTLIAGDSEGFERSATIERFLGILRTCSEGLDWRRSEPRRPLSRAATSQTYHGQFRDILETFDKDQSFGIPPFTRSAHMDPVAELFEAHPDILDRLVRLVEEFGYGGTEEPAPEAAPEAAPSRRPPEGRIDFNTANEFVDKIKARSTADAGADKRFLEILRTYSDIKEVYAHVAELFKDQPDLLSEFAHFLPARVTEPSPEPSPAPTPEHR